jgi:nucleotide-binding universal stress UspA family protein
MFHHVLVPLDLRFLPRSTLRTAALFASEQKADVTLLYVYDVRRDFLGAAVNTVFEDEIERHRARVQLFLDNAAAVISEYGANAATCTVRGRPVHEIVKRMALRLGADLIVMGTHGRRGLAHAWWGSVTEEVLREASVPVLVVNESPSATAPRAESGPISDEGEIRER